MHLLLQKRISVLLILISNMVWNNNTYAEVVGTNQVDKINKENLQLTEVDWAGFLTKEEAQNKIFWRFKSMLDLI